MSDLQTMGLFLFAALSGLALTGASDFADQERIAAVKAAQPVRPALLRHELHGCAPDLMRRDDGSIWRDCGKWAIYDDGREVLVGIVKQKIEPSPEARYALAARAASSQRVIP